MAEVEAHITGTVWKIEVALGDVVAEGDGAGPARSSCISTAAGAVGVRHAAATALRLATMSTTSLAIAAVLPGRPRVLADALPHRRVLDATLVLAGAGLTTLGAQISIHGDATHYGFTGRLDGGVER